MTVDASTVATDVSATSSGGDSSIIMIFSGITLVRMSNYYDHTNLLEHEKPCA